MTPEQKQQALELTASLCIEFEGFESKPYLCPANVPTIGIGFTSYADGRKVSLNDKPMTRDAAEALLIGLLKTFQAAVLKACPNIESIGLLAACTDLAYNIGASAFSSSTLCKVINSGGDNAAIAAQIRRWNKAGGKALAGLTRRREAEIAII